MPLLQTPPKKGSSCKSRYPRGVNGPGTLAGVDGCPGGWVAAVERAHTVEIVVVRSLRELLEREPFRVVALDMPIGLTDAGPRPADVRARAFLGPRRGTSVMPAPLRAAATASSHAEATALRRKVEGKGVSVQAYGIYPKVAEVDALLRSSEAAREALVEGHPEVSFALLAGAPVLAKKRTPEGAALRRALLEGGVRPSARVRLPPSDRPPRRCSRRLRPPLDRPPHPRGRGTNVRRRKGRRRVADADRGLGESGRYPLGRSTGRRGAGQASWPVFSPYCWWYSSASQKVGAGWTVVVNRPCSFRSCAFKLFRAVASSSGP